ncbi:MAG: hypothetical protein D6768_17525 [Chloroflexi bacterium]|nr:MAG: hypothetical protein D6768_17525 [Chloroflexota bacterium]
MKITKQMTLEEKAALCTGNSAWTTPPVERLDVPELIMSDGPHCSRHLPAAGGLDVGAGQRGATTLLAVQFICLTGAQRSIRPTSNRINQLL